MKLKNKGKIHPTPPPPPPPPQQQPSNDDVLSVLNFLPTAILTLTTLLSLQDREVLAYMITRSPKSPTSKKQHPTTPLNNREATFFDCDCFDCYTSFWLKWDSSPNRELIHEVIEAFEDHLANTETSSSSKTKKRVKPGSRVDYDCPGRLDEAEMKEKDGTSEGEGSVEREVVPVVLSGSPVNRRGLTRKVLPDVLGLLNSRLWSLWSSNV